MKILTKRNPQTRRFKTIQTQRIVCAKVNKKIEASDVPKLEVIKHLMPKSYLKRALLAGFLGILGLILNLPNVKQLGHVQYQVPLQIFSQDQKLIAYFGEKKRFPAQLDQIPKTLQHAFISAEDQRFYHHIGIDWLGLSRASVALIVHKGKKTQGASTITMQVARNFYLSNKKTFARKINEILLSLKIEQSLSKSKILELYLNKIYLGERSYGVAAAAQVYYNKSLQELTLAESAMLAGLPKAPSANNPIKNPTRALKRRNYVLERMAHLGYITQHEAEQAQEAPISAKLYAPKIEVEAPHAADLVRQIMVNHYGNEAYTRGFKVTTTLQSKTQKAANKALNKGLIDYTKRHGFSGTLSHITLDEWEEKAPSFHEPPQLKVAITIESHEKKATLLLKNGQKITLYLEGNTWARKKLKHGYRSSEPKSFKSLLQQGDVVYVSQSGKHWTLAQAPEAQGSLLALNPGNGEILAMVGGYDFQKSHYNRTTQAKRQAGSAFKPFIYATALEKGMTLASVINDSPIIQSDQNQTTWRPKNSTEQFHGPTRLREGLVRSRNLVSIRLLDQIGIKPTIENLQYFGFQTNDLPLSLSLSLGASTHTPIELVRGFASFANGGYLPSPFIIEHITTPDQRIVYQSRPLVACQDCEHKAPRAMSQETAYLMNQALLDVIKKGTGRRASSLKRNDIGGKTGTTNKQKDAWFIGFNRNIVASVWVGYDHPKTLYEYGAQAALPIWIDFMQDTLKGQKSALLARPSTIISARIDPVTGERLKHAQKGSTFELFDTHKQS